MKKALFIDRDGVINDLIDRGNDFFVKGKRVRYTAPFEFNEFKIKNGVANFIKKAKGLDYLIILISNQPDVAYGNLSLKNHNEIMRSIEYLNFDDIYICKHGRDDNCNCKKPKPGMLIEAALKWKIDLSKSYFLGDTIDDLKAARAAGCPSIIIGDNLKNDVEKPDWRASSFEEVINILINRN